MDNKEFLDKLTGVNPALECLAFLYHRILRDDYRGTHKLQHYRWSAKYIKLVLKNLHKFSDKDGFLYHTRGDIYEDYVYANDLAAGQSQSFDIFTYVSSDKLIFS